MEVPKRLLESHMQDHMVHLQQGLNQWDVAGDGAGA